MRKINFLFMALSCLISIACKKDRTCECTSSSSITSSDGQVYVMTPGTDATTSSSIVYKNVKRSEMKSLCGDAKYINISSSSNSNGSSTTLTQETISKCHLK